MKENVPFQDAKLVLFFLFTQVFLSKKSFLFYILLLHSLLKEKKGVVWETHPFRIDIGCLGGIIFLIFFYAFVFTFNQDSTTKYMVVCWHISLPVFLCRCIAAINLLYRFRLLCCKTTHISRSLFFPHHQCRSYSMWS